jgi:hypothetical protein
MIIRLDGQIIRKSNTIDSISLWLPAGAVPKLAQQESVGWISLDGVVQSDSADNESVPNMFEGTPAGVTD